MTEQVKNKKKSLMLVSNVIAGILLSAFILLCMFYPRYAPEHPHFDTFAALYYSAMAFSLFGSGAFYTWGDDLKEELKDKNWFVTGFIPTIETPPPFRYVVKAIDKDEAEAKFKIGCPNFKIVDISNE